MPNPRVHPGMAHVFDALWPLQLKQQLAEFTAAHLAGVRTPQLAQIHRLWRSAEGAVDRHMKALVGNYETMKGVTYNAVTLAMAALGQQVPSS